MSIFVVIGGRFFAGKKKLGVKVRGNLELVQSYQIQLFIIPIWFQKRIMLYDFSNSKYYELDSRLENRLFKLGKQATPEELSNVIKQYEKEENEKINYYEAHKEEIEKKENKEFVKFLKGIIIFILLLILILIIRWIFF